ncbi:MAG: XRE family transcriptional regulator [Pseudomonadota bacterium]
MEDAPPNDVDRRLAQRLKGLRMERGWSLDALAERSGVSRATLSRFESGAVSPTAQALGRIGTAYGMAMSRLIALAEAAPDGVIARSAQVEWRDPESGFRRRAVSPPAGGLAGDVVEGVLPAGSEVAYPRPPRPGLEHHVALLSGDLEIVVEGRRFALSEGDAARFRLYGASRYRAPGPEPARYLIFTV